MIEASRARLFELLRTLSFAEREVVLSSGLRSNFYVDCKQTTLTAEGHVLVGRVLLAEIDAYERAQERSVAAVGGLTLGADPIASAISLTSGLGPRPLPAFIVRKEPKGHGTGTWIEGLDKIAKGSEVVILEDVVTTGASGLRAVQRAREAGYEVRLMLALVDRLEGGRQAIEAEDCQLVSLFTRDDFLPR